MSGFRDSKGRKIVIKDSTYQGVDFYIAEDRVVEREQKPQLRAASDTLDKNIADRVNKISLDDR